MIEITRDNTGNLLVGKTESPKGHTKSDLFETWVFDDLHESINMWVNLCREKETDVRRQKFEGCSKILEIFKQSSNT
jgi:hypothetical protein